MPYSNDQSQIRAGLVNYIGAMLNASIYDDDLKKKHQVAAIISEELAILCQNNNDDYEMFACKPVFRLVSNIAKSRYNMLCDLESSEVIDDKKKMYKSIFTNLDLLIESIK